MDKTTDELKRELQSTAQLLQSILPILQKYQQHYTLPDGLTNLVQKKVTSLSSKAKKL